MPREKKIVDVQVGPLLAWDSAKVVPHGTQGTVRQAIFILWLPCHCIMVGKCCFFSLSGSSREPSGLGFHCGTQTELVVFSRRGFLPSQSCPSNNKPVPFPSTEPARQVQNSHFSNPGFFFSCLQTKSPRRMLFYCLHSMVFHKISVYLITFSKIYRIFF